MIDLRNKKIVVRSKKECDDLLEYAREQGFRWVNGSELYSEKMFCAYPCSIKFCNNLTASYQGLSDATIYLFSWFELKNNHVDLTAGEFIDFIVNVKEKCSDGGCSNCVIDESNTRCRENLCLISNWDGHKDELIAIAKNGKVDIKANSKEVARAIQNYIDRKDRMPLPEDIMGYLKLAVDKLKEN